MKTLILGLLFFVSSCWSSEEAKTLQIQQTILETIKEMPVGGAYELTDVPAQKMADAFSWENGNLELNPELAKPSYCTTAMYMLMYKVLQKLWAKEGFTPSLDVLIRLKPQMEKDGERIWGRFNSNGPGQAKLFYDAKLGVNFDDIEKARAGDFLKIFWNDQVGKNERGHTVIYLGRETVNGVEMIRFWGSSKSTSGFGEKLIPRTDAVRTLFTRLTHPENVENIVTIPENDSFLSSMLTEESSWEELTLVTGLNQ